MVITTEFEEALKKHIQEIEGKSAVEIVPAMIERASTYTAWILFYSLLLGVVSSKIFSYFFPLWVSTPYLADFLQTLILFFAWHSILSRSHCLLWLIPKNEINKKCSLAAENIFLEESVFDTKDRTGILIAVFKFEKRILVLADKGFESHVDKKYWPKLGVALARDFNRKKAGEEFFEALIDIENKVAPHFNAKNSTNEISDHLRKR